MDFEWKNDTGWQKWPKMKFPYDEKVEVELKEMLEIRETPNGVDVRQWGVCLPHATLDTLESRLTDLFRELCHHAELSFREGKSDPSKMQIWMRVVKTIRYEQFSWDISPAMYEELEVVAVGNTQGVLLRRRDGKEDVVSFSLMPYVINSGDRIGAYVKRGRRQEIVEFTYDDMLPPVSKKEADRLWNSLKRL